MRNPFSSLNWNSVILCVLISGMFLSFVLKTFFVQTLMLWLLGGFAIYTGMHTRKFYFQWYSVCFFAMFLLRFFAFLRNPDLPFSHIEQSLSMVLFPLIFSLVVVDEKMWKTIQKIVVIGISVFLLVILYNFYTHIYLENLVRETFANSKHYYSLFLKPPFHDHPSFLAIILTPVISMCFNLAAKSEKIWQQWLWLGPIPLLMFVTFMIGSRIGVLVCGVLIVLCCVYFFKKLNAVSAFALGVMLGVMLLGSQISKVTYTEDPIRKEAFNFAVEKIKEQPLLGYGCGMQNMILNDTVNPVVFEAGFVQILDYFHNAFVDEIFQFGFLGALPFLLLVLYLIYISIRKRNIFLFSFLAIYLPFFYVETPFQVLKGIMPLMLFLTVTMSVENSKKIVQNG